MSARYLYFNVIQFWMLLVAVGGSSGEEAPIDYIREEDYELNKDFLDGIQGSYEIVYPIQVRRNIETGISTRDLKSRHKHAHFHHTNFIIEMLGKRYKLKLDLSQHLVKKPLKQMWHIDENTQRIKEDVIELCYYHGRIRRVKDATVSVSTCDGLRGYIGLNNETYQIQPLPVMAQNEVIDTNVTRRRPHVLYKIKGVDGKSCATELGQWKDFQTLHKAEYLRRLKIMKSRKSDTMEMPNTRPIKLALVLDYSLAANLNNSHENMFTYALEISNLIDMYMRQLGLSVSLVYTEVWNMRAQFNVNSQVREVLENLLVYTERIPPMAKQDIVQFITMQQFEGQKIGVAIPESICTNRAVGVSQVDSISNPLQVAAVVSHMISHNLGLHHISAENCGCEDKKGCVMPTSVLNWNGQNLPGFSNCSKDQLVNLMLQSGFGACLLDDNKTSYPQICGNGRLERGEECDCGSEEECYFKDPCCNPSTCLLKPWATCRYGRCCYNCTLLPSDHVCRLPASECDVPEYCDGLQGQCPGDDIVLDGQPCSSGDGYCYLGQCNTYNSQCAAIWGPGATKAVPQCYKQFNSAGNFNGHCGKTTGGSQYIKCEEEHIQCGLLQCAGGAEKPNVASDKTYANTEVSANGNQFQCKIIHDKASDGELLIGMVRDGTRCDLGKICLNHTCTDLGELIAFTCIRGPNGITCSGTGVCNNRHKCHCDLGYTGIDCSIKMNITTTTTTKPSTRILSHHTTRKTTTGLTTTAATKNLTVPKDIVKTIAEPPVSTLWLVIVLASVVGGCILLMGFCFLCYRRRSPADIVYQYKKKKIFGKKLPKFSWDKHEDSFNSEDAANRIISFGNLPSYRDEKMKELQKQQQRLLKGLSNVSGSGSEQGHSARNSAEVGSAVTLPLAKPPEKGILKKFPRSSESLPSSARRSRASLIQEVTELLNSREPREIHSRDSGSNSSVAAGTQTSPDGIASTAPPHLNIPPPPPASLSMYGLKPLPPVNNVQETDTATSPEGNVEEGNASDSSIQKEPLSDDEYYYEQEDDFEKDPADFDSDADDADSFCTECQREQERTQELLQQSQPFSPSPKDPDGPKSASSRNSQGSISPHGGSSAGSSQGSITARNLNVDGPTGAKKLKNLDDLFRQLDEQLQQANMNSPEEICSDGESDYIRHDDDHNDSGLPLESILMSCDMDEMMSPENIRNSYISCISPEPLFSPVLPDTPSGRHSPSMMSPNTPSCIVSPGSTNSSPTKMNQILARNLRGALQEGGVLPCSPGSSGSQSSSSSPVRRNGLDSPKEKSDENLGSFKRLSGHNMPNTQCSQSSTPQLDGHFPHPYSSVRNLSRSQADRPTMLNIANTNKPVSPKKKFANQMSSLKFMRSPNRSPSKSSGSSAASSKQGTLEKVREASAGSIPPVPPRAAKRLSGANHSPSPIKLNRKQMASSPASSHSSGSSSAKYRTEQHKPNFEDSHKPDGESPPAYFRPIQPISDSSSDRRSADSNLNSGVHQPDIAGAGAAKPNPASKLTNPRLDGYPLCKRHSLATNDCLSNSEGYFSDRMELDDNLVIQEIPLSESEVDDKLSPAVLSQKPNKSL